MNVAFVVHRYDASEGTGGYVTELLPRVAREHEVTLYAADVVTPPPAGIRVVRVPAFRQPAIARILSFPRAFRRVAGTHDVVHAQGWVAEAADVVTAHIVLGAWRDAAGPAGALSRGERIAGRLVLAGERRLLRRAPHVIAPSRSAGDDIARWYGRTGSVHVVPHGFTRRDVPARDRRAFDLPDDGFVALYVGDARKGLATTIRAVAGTDAWLMVASHSPPAPYHEIARTTGVDGRLRWAGPLADVGRAYAAADVLVHPTIYDTFGLAVAEAMVAGLPVIVSPRAGIVELLTDGEDGLVAHDLTATTAALGRLRRDPDLRRRLGAAAQRTAAAYTWDRTAAATLSVYQQVRSR